MITFLYIPLFLTAALACLLYTVFEFALEKAVSKTKAYMYKKRMKGVERLENKRAFVSTNQIQRS